MGDTDLATGQEKRYADAVAAVGPALERLARAYERDPDKCRDLLKRFTLRSGLVALDDSLEPLATAKILPTPAIALSGCRSEEVS